jgi:NhaP-type Na+/H+ or K+/H+ antiporter
MFQEFVSHGLWDLVCLTVAVCILLAQLFRPIFCKKLRIDEMLSEISETVLE